MKNINKTQTLLVGLCLFVLGSIYVRFLIQTHKDSSTHLSQTTYTYTSNLPSDQPLQLLWSENGVFIEYGNQHFCPNQNDLWFSGSLKTDPVTSFVKVDLTTGGLKKLPDLGYAFSVACDSENMYFGEQSELIAIHTQNTQINWSVNIPELHNPQTANGGDVFYTYSLDGERLTIRKIDGKLLDIGLYNPSHTPLLVKNNVEYTYNAQGIFAKNLSNNSIIWEKSFASIDFSPVIKTDFIYVHDAGNNQLNKLDLTDGDILWSKNMLEDRFLVGNFYANDHHIFFLDSRSHLVLLNAQNGNVYKTFPFDSEKNTSMQQEHAKRNHIVYVVKNTIVVYFDDSHQLFAFKFTPPDSEE